MSECKVLSILERLPHVVLDNICCVDCKWEGTLMIAETMHPDIIKCPGCNKAGTLVDK